MITILHTVRMDIYCTKCSEPLAHDELHYIEDKTFAQARDAFLSEGCVGIGYVCNPDTEALRDPLFGLTAGEAMGALVELLGDDMDGAAAMMEDMGF